ncbi:MAG: GxxExxY protein [Verrucomicrobiota bacterium]
MTRFWPNESLERTAAGDFGFVISRSSESIGFDENVGHSEAVVQFDRSIKEDGSRRHGDTEMNENGIGTIVVDCAVELHRDWGPGLLETVYEVTLARALERRGLRVQRQVAVAIEYRGEVFHEGFRADLIVENLVIVEFSFDSRSVRSREAFPASNRSARPVLWLAR